MEQRFVETGYVEHVESQSLAEMSYTKMFFQPEYGIDTAQSELTSLAYSIIRLLPFGVSVLPIGLPTVSRDMLSEMEMRDLAGATGDGPHRKSIQSLVNGRV